MEICDDQKLEPCLSVGVFSQRGQGLRFLTTSVADRERAKRLDEPRGFRRRYPKTKNFFVTMAINDLLADYGLSQFCVAEAEPASGRVRRFAVPMD
jgi:hypothetical protein